MLSTYVLDWTEDVYKRQKQVKLLAELAVVALFGFLHHVEISLKL